MEDRLLDACDAAAREARDWVKAALAQWDPARINTWTKASAADLASEADVAIEQGVRQILRDRVAGVAVVGEEEGGEPSADDAGTWYLDPIDGTTNFIHGIPFSAFSLGLVDRAGVPVLGMVVNLATGDEFYGRKGRGLWLNGVRVERRPDTDLRGAVVLAELAGHRAWPGLDGAARWIADEWGTLRVLGSSALALAETAVGHAAGALLGSFSPWDVAAGVALCREAGLTVRDRAGGSPPLPVTGLVAAPGPLAAALGEKAFRWSDAMPHDAGSQPQ